MKYAFVLSKEIVELAAEEVLSLTNSKKRKLINNILIADIKNKKSANKLYERLAYTNSIHSLLFESPYTEFIEKFKNFDWQSIYKGSFCVRVNNISAIKEKTIRMNNELSSHKKVKSNKTNNKIPNKNNSNNKNIENKNNKDAKKPEEIENLSSEIYLASFIWRKIKNPKVDLENPSTQINVFFTEKRAYCCLLLKNLEHYFQSRRPHLRPAPSPISLHPKLARAIINLTGAKEGDIILDPFCGSGGILLEAGLMGMKIEGYDLNRKMVWKSMTNLNYYGIKYDLKVKDFFKINKKYKYIAADLPYGLNACIMENVRVTKANRKEITPFIDKFYSKVVKKLEEIVGKRAIIIFPDYSNYKKLIKNSKLKIKKEFSCYVHGNLTRKILVLEK